MPLTEEIPAGSQCDHVHPFLLPDVFRGVFIVAYTTASLTSGVLDGILGLAHENNAVNPTWVPTIYGNIVKVCIPRSRDRSGF